MKITKAQAQANREHVVATASKMFRERGYDGVGVADLMAAAGFTHGGFHRTVPLQGRPDGGIGGLRHRADGGTERRCETRQSSCSITFLASTATPAQLGCAMAALGGDAARQPESGSDRVRGWH
ncbi:TetR/AcrR family transcriptional regulator [Cupriavidus basilensis]